MAEKLYNLKVKNGTYMKDGEEKQNYLAVGVVLKGDYGPYMILDKTFNPAGIETEGWGVIPVWGFAGIIVATELRLKKGELEKSAA